MVQAQKGTKGSTPANQPQVNQLSSVGKTNNHLILAEQQPSTRVAASIGSRTLPAMPSIE
eukprot:4523395-Amphidinium_carterae.1